MNDAVLDSNIETGSENIGIILLFSLPIAIVTVIAIIFSITI